MTVRQQQQQPSHASRLEFGSNGEPTNMGSVYRELVGGQGEMQRSQNLAQRPQSRGHGKYGALRCGQGS